MSKKDKKVKAVVVEEQSSTGTAGSIVQEVPVASSEAKEVPKKKYYYNPVTAKAYRDRIKAAAVVGGYVPQERKPGTGQTEKRTSKSGTNYYYTPWSKLTEEQKQSRLASARARMAQEREDAKKYREEHPEVKA